MTTATGTRRMPSDALFLDSAYAIALASATDQHHREAAQLAAELKKKPARLITTRAVMLEIGNALARPPLRSVGVELLAHFEADEQTIVLTVDERLYQRGFQAFRQRTDKAWSLTDCISFEEMREHGLNKALTPDQINAAMSRNVDPAKISIFKAGDFAKNPPAK